MGANSSEQVKIVQQILETLDQQKVFLDRATSNFNRRKIEVENQLKDDREVIEKATIAIEQTRIHLRKELEKLDPIFLHDCESSGCRDGLHVYSK